MVTETKDAHSPLRSQFPTDFRAGLKLPHIDLTKSAMMKEPDLLDVHTPPPFRSQDSPRRSLNVNSNKSRSSSSKVTDGGGGDAGAAHEFSAKSLSQDPSLLSIRSVTITGKSKKGGGDQVEHEINQRISNVYRSIESLEKKRQNFDNSLRAAARRTVADIAKNNASRPSTSSLRKKEQVKAITPAAEAPVPAIMPLRKSSRIIDVTRTYPKMFGLDPMKVIASSEDESDDEVTTGNPKKGTHGDRRKPKKSIRKYLELLVQEEPPRDMSAIMPSLSEKTFLTKLQKRENQLNKEINDMRVNLDVMHMKADREAKKGKIEMRYKKGIGTFAVIGGKRPNITRLLAGDPSGKGPARELTDFLQATGGATGGWEPGDHHVFVRGYQKWSTNPAVMVENLTRLLPNKKPEDVVEHATWYEKYERLNNANRSHIRKWQLSKRKERETVFRMANQSQRAELEKEKYHQDLIKAKRAEELEREKELLQSWKRSKETRSRKPRSGVAEEGTLDTGLKISKMDLEMSEMRKEIREITAMTKDIGKSLRSLEKTEERPRKKITERVGTGGSDASSGFCEMTMEEIEAVGQDLEGDGEKFLGKMQSLGISAAQPKNVVQALETKKMLQDFRARDSEMISAKKKAIESRREKQRNKAFLTDTQIKERMKKIKANSKLTEPTKGWMIRNEIRELEKVESQNRRLSSATGMKEDVMKDAFAPVNHVTNIPKLGTPLWRKIN